MSKTLPDDVTKVPPDERVARVSAVLGSLEQQAAAPLPARQLAELNRCRDDADASRDGYRDWVDVKARIEPT